MHALLRVPSIFMSLVRIFVHLDFAVHLLSIPVLTGRVVNVFVVILLIRLLIRRKLLNIVRLLLEIVSMIPVRFSSSEFILRPKLLFRV